MSNMSEFHKAQRKWDKGIAKMEAKQQKELLEAKKLKNAKKEKSKKD